MSSSLGSVAGTAPGSSATREISPPYTSELALKSFMDLPYLMQASSKDGPSQPETPWGRSLTPWSQMLGPNLPFLVLRPYKLGEKNKNAWSRNRFVCWQQIVKNQLSVYVP